MVLTGVFIAIGITFPMAFHLFEGQKTASYAVSHFNLRIFPVSSLCSYGGHFDSGFKQPYNRNAANFPQFALFGN